MIRTAIETADGTITCFNTEVGEAYHNRIGAKFESYQIYVNPSCIEKRLETANTVSILDPYFGMGYNTFSAIAQFYALPNTADKKLNVVAVEMDPLILKSVPEVFEHYGAELPESLKKAFAHKIYYQTQVDPVDYSQEPYLYWQDGNISLELWVADTRSFVKRPINQQFDVIYHDAFSTLKQPELWTIQLFEKYKVLLEPQYGAIITYSQSAAMRGSLIEAGFTFLYQQITPETIRAGTIACLSPQQFDPQYWEPAPEEAYILIESKAGLPFIDNETLDLSSAEILQARDKTHETSKRMTSSQAHKKVKYLTLR